MDVQGFPEAPFSSGTFQNAFKAACVVPNKYLELGANYVLKQQKIEERILQGEINIDSLSAVEIDSIDAECEKKSAKVTQGNLA